jgi:hypothetical protein
MKMKSALLWSTLLVLSACKKSNDEPVTKPVEFTATTYENSCGWNSAGKPDCLLDRDSISAGLLAFLNNTIPEGHDLRTSNPGLLSTNASADIKITQSSDVFITFVSKGTSSMNTLGYYTFPSDMPPTSAADIHKITYIFPNAGDGTPLRPGDKVKIGRFAPGTTIGFVLLQNGWNPTTFAPDKNAVHFCTDDVLNPEIDPALKKHAVLLTYAPENKTLIGFDDSNRTTANCDHDFNDVVFYVTLVP